MMPGGRIIPTQVPGAFSQSPSSHSYGLARGRATCLLPCMYVCSRSFSPQRAMSWQNSDFVLCETWKVKAKTIWECSFYLFIYFIIILKNIFTCLYVRSEKAYNSTQFQEHWTPQLDIFVSTVCGCHCPVHNEKRKKKDFSLRSMVGD